MCFVALGVGAVIAPLPFGRRVRLYGLLGLPVGAVCAWLAWNGSVSRLGGLLLVVLYIVYVAVVWRIEGAPPVLGEAGEIEVAEEERAASGRGGQRRVGRDFGLIIAGVVAMSIGAKVLVEGIGHVAAVDPRRRRSVCFARWLCDCVRTRGARGVGVAARARPRSWSQRWWWVRLRTTRTMTLGACPGAAAHDHRSGRPRATVVMLAALALAVALGWPGADRSGAPADWCCVARPLFVIGVLAW